MTYYKNGDKENAKKELKKALELDPQFSGADESKDDATGIRMSQLQTGKEHFIGLLPERRKNLKRITKESILNWGWMVIGRNSDVNDIYYVQIEM